jgi:ketosteroid isomerase-like protein
MTTQQAVDEKDIRQRVENLIEAVRSKDLDTVKTIFAPDLVSFDIEPPLQHLGAEAKWKNWLAVFEAFQQLDYETRDLTISVSGDLAVVHAVNRISGTMNNGNTIGYWLRWTACFRRIDGDWLIAHDHVSVPTDFTTGQAKLDLKP